MRIRKLDNEIQIKAGRKVLHLYKNNLVKGWHFNKVDWGYIWIHIPFMKVIIHWEVRPF